MVSLFVTGVSGAVLSVALSSLGVVDTKTIAKQLSLERLEVPAQAAIGFAAGCLAVVVLSFFRKRAIRLLLAYDHWFIAKPNFFDKLWFVCLKLLLSGGKNRGIRGYQDVLPTLPVPPLKKTCERFLITLRPILTDEEYKDTEQAVAEFLAGKGPYIQRMLYLQSWKKRNWCSDWWIEYVYLRSRGSIMINSNYYALDSFKLPTPHQLDRAAVRVHCSLKFMMEEKKGKLPNMLAKGLVPFCGHYFNSTHGLVRVPGVETDTLVRHEDSRHIVVIRKGQYFKVTVIDDSGNIMPPKQMKKIFKQIVETTGDEEQNNYIAALTAQARDVWAKQRETLMQNAANAEVFDAIDSCIVVCSLDHQRPETLLERANDCFVGNGSNRWLDKGVSYIFSENGRTSANVEHSALDATVTAQIWEYAGCTEKYDQDGHLIEEGMDIKVDPYKKLNWCFDGHEEFLVAARENYEAMVADSDLAVGDGGYGKSIPKKARLSPDGWFQMAIQLAFYRIHKKIVLTYESATTRMFYKGRTETIRPVSQCSVKFVQHFDELSVTPELKKKLLKEAISYQEQYKLEAMRGLAIDRHLFGLYLVAKGLNVKPFPRLMEHVSYRLPFTLSTSQTPTKLTKYYRLDRAAQLGGFGTVTDNGYGVSYIVNGEDTVYFSVHSKKSCPETDSSRMLEQIRGALNDMKNLFGL